MEQDELNSKRQKIDFIYNSCNNLQRAGLKTKILATWSDEELDEHYNECVALAIHNRKVLAEYAAMNSDMRIFVDDLTDTRINKLFSTMTCIQKVRAFEIKTYIIGGLALLCVVVSFFIKSYLLFYTGLALGFCFLFFNLKLKAQIKTIISDKDIIKLFPKDF
jgi:hypothetical protein